MSDILEKFAKLKKFSQTLCHEIRLFLVFDDYLGKNCLYLTTDDKCYAFGSNLVGCLGFGHNKFVEEPELVPELSHNNITDLYRGSNFIIGRTEQNRIYCWGQNECGQLGLGFKSAEDKYLKPAFNEFLSAKNVVRVCCGHKHVIAITANGDVFGWGDNSEGQVGAGLDQSVVQTPTNLSSISSELNIKSIACGDSHSLALTADNFVFAWGSNHYGQLATGDFVSSNLPTLVPAPKLDIQKIICSKNTTYFLTKQTTVHFCGENYMKGFGPKTAIVVEVKCPTPFLDIVSCAPSLSICLAKTDGSVYELMRNELSFFETDYKNFDQYFTQNFHLTYKTMSMTEVVENSDECMDIENCFIDHLKLFPGHLKKVIDYYYVFDDIDGKNCIYVTIDDDVFAFGTNYGGILGIGDVGPVEEPVLIREICGKHVSQFFHGNGFLFAKNHLNEIYCWGQNKFGQLGLGYECAYLKPVKNNYLSVLAIESLSCGQSHTLALTRAGDAYSWGGNEWGQVGANSPTKIISVPTRVDIFLKIKSVSAGDHHSMVLTQGKSVLSWGRNDYGQLGRFGYPYSPGPTSIIQNDIISIACNQDNSYLLDKYGTVSVHGKLVCSFNSHATPSIAKLPNTTTDTTVPTDTKLCASSNGTVVAAYRDKLYELRRTAIPLTEQDHFEYGHHLAENHDVTCWPVRVVNYDKVRFLGSGSFGDVYQCRSRISAKVFAVKILINQDLTNKQIGKIFTTLEKLCHIKSKHLAEIKKVWLENDKVIHIGMDYYPMNLADLILEKYLAFNRAIGQQMSLVEFGVSMEIFRQIVEAIEYLHRLKPPIIHRNLKSTNVLISDTTSAKSFIKICDFGYNSFADSGLKSRYGTEIDDNYSSYPVMCGTDYQMKADVYCLAVIGQELFEIGLFNNPSNQIGKYIWQGKFDDTMRLIASMQAIPKWWFRPEATEVLEQMDDLYPSADQLKSSTDFKNIHDSLQSYRIQLFNEIVKSLL